MAGTIPPMRQNSPKKLKQTNSEFKQDPKKKAEESSLYNQLLEQADNSRLQVGHLNSFNKQDIILDNFCLEDADGDQLWSYSYLIVSFLQIFYWSLLVPNGLQYDESRARFYTKKAGLRIKILSYAWLLCICVYLTFFMLYDLNKPYTVKVITGKITWGCYCIFDITVITCLRINGDQLAKLLTDGNAICHLQHQLIHTANSKKERSRIERNYIVWMVSGLTLTYTIFFMIFVMTELTASKTNFYHVYLDLTTRGNLTGCGGLEDEKYSYVDLYYPCTSKKQILCNLFERCTTNLYASILLIIWFFIAFTVELTWITFLLMTGACGSYFKKMFMDCICLIENGQVDLLQGIRIYTKISLLLEDFNKIFGYSLLWITIASILYQAITTLGGLLSGYTNGLMFDVVNVLGFVPFIATVYTASELHRIGHTLPSLIKKQFLNMDMVIRDHDQTLRMIQGTSVVQFDAVSNTMGMKGAGFFTLSYTFVGSMIGVIITYSLVTAQFKLEEITLV